MSVIKQYLRFCFETCSVGPTAVSGESLGTKISNVVPPQLKGEREGEVRQRLACSLFVCLIVAQFTV